MNQCDDPGGARDPYCNVRTAESIRSRASRSGYLGRSGTGVHTDDRWVLLFYLKGTMDECVIKNRIEHQTIGLPLKFQGEPLLEYNIRNIGWELWECQAVYAWSGPTAVGGAQLPTQISFSTGGGRKKLTQSLLTVGAYPDSGDGLAPNINGAINWDGEKVSGVDIISASPRYTETWIFDRTTLFSAKGQTVVPVEGGQDRTKSTYSNMLNLWTDYTGTVHGSPSADNPVNADPLSPSEPIGPFRGWAEGEVLFTGAQMRQIATDYFEVTYEFQISPTLKLFLPESVEQEPPAGGGDVEPIFVEGWDYLWYMYAEKEEEVGTGGASPYKMNAALPKFAYVDEVYRRRNFQGLGVGTNPFIAQFIGLLNCDCGAGSQEGDFSMIGDWQTYCYPPGG